MVGDTSASERNRLHLAKTLLEGANVLVLDEPTKDLEGDTLRALGEARRDFAGCAVVISHDPWFLDRVATHVMAVEGARKWCDSRGYQEEVRGRREPEADQPRRVV